MSDVDKERGMTTEELMQLITEYGMYLYSFCCNITGNKMDADDLYQDTFLKAAELRHKLNSSGNPKSYLMGISVKLWQNQRKKYAVRQRILPMVEYDENLVQDEIDTGIQPGDSADIELGRLGTPVLSTDQRVVVIEQEQTAIDVPPEKDGPDCLGKPRRIMLVCRIRRR